MWLQVMVEEHHAGDQGHEVPVLQKFCFPGAGRAAVCSCAGVGWCCCGVPAVEQGLPSCHSVPCVFQMPQVLVKLKKYPQGDKVRWEGCLWGQDGAGPKNLP